MLGPHFALIGFGVNPADGLDYDARRLLEDLSVQLARVTSHPARCGAGDVPESHDSSRVLIEWSRRAASIVLVRPDRHVYAVFTANQSSEIVRDLALALTGFGHGRRRTHDGSDAKTCPLTRRTAVAPPRGPVIR